MGKKGYTLVELMIVVLAFAVIPGIVVGETIWTSRSLDFWISHAKAAPVHVSYWLCFLVAVVGNGVVLIGNIVSEIARYFI